MFEPENTLLIRQHSIRALPNTSLIKARKQDALEDVEARIVTLAWMKCLSSLKTRRAVTVES
ncbi:MAG: hypothetical protein IPO13_00790 [Rhodocyclaceae bacterium]|nr:hypothetical protein [Rhodocyclaceae bacterium]